VQPFQIIFLKMLAQLVALSPTAKILAAGVFALSLAAVAALYMFAPSSQYQFVFTNMSASDSAASGEALKAAGIPFRLEAAGDAIAVPSNKVHEARLLLAAQGLPKASGVGFELFDKGDLGVSEFTQRVNQQRAMEGELQRTISSMEKVRDARVHITMSKRRLFRTEDKGASAAVMITLHAGRVLDSKEIAGLRHLVAAAVPELDAESVTLVDSSGTLLGGDNDADALREGLERALEKRVVDVLEPAVGHGAVVARVTATMNADQIEETDSVYNPETVIAVEHTRTENTTSKEGVENILAGAAGNEPPKATPAKGERVANRSSDVKDATHTYNVSGTVTRRVTQAPRITRLSIAVLLHEGEGKAIAAPALKKLTDLAKRAVGFDEERGDLLQLSTATFQTPPAPPLAEAPLAVPATTSLLTSVGIGVGALLALAAAVFVLLRLTRRKKDGTAQALLPPPLPEAKPVVLSNAAENARRLATEKPGRAAQILEAWLTPTGLPSGSTKDTTRG
jgi:flagellar M-ring protein FliF